MKARYRTDRTDSQSACVPELDMSSSSRNLYKEFARSSCFSYLMSVLFKRVRVQNNIKINFEA